MLWSTEKTAYSLIGAICGLVLSSAMALGVVPPVAAEELRRPEAVTHHYAQLRHIKLHYVREGSGPPLILLHGWPGFWWEYHRNIGPLAKDFDVIVPDHAWRRAYSAGATDKDLQSAAAWGKLLCCRVCSIRP